MNAQNLLPANLARRHQVGLLAIVGILLAPAVLPQILVYKATAALFFAVFVMCWDAVSGYTGQISLGHALFYGVGAYTSGLLNVHLGLPVSLTIPAGVVVAALAGVLIGVPALRLEGPYLGLITLVAPLILVQIFVIFSDVTGGELGLLGLDTIVDGVIANYYIAVVIFLISLAIFIAVTRSDAGKVFTAIKTDSEVVDAVGINSRKFKLFSFVLSGTVGGLAGAFYVHTPVGTASPSQVISLMLSIEVVIATLVGGIGTITGAALGGFLYWFIRDALRSSSVVLPVLNTPISELDMVIFMLLAIGVLFYLPDGVLPRIVRWGARLDPFEVSNPQSNTSEDDDVNTND
ncbi:branched-chain amino acid ABC transporter permease [Halobacterium noricense]|uniref:branched-chain amino acid ABC transporter permease n=1 Tax=Halobacterium noricense TaxID=223182 RepID=UPI001E28D14A|nr:branched-chain amino acid ABC transporter permease [Halobacterium noricense]UHH23956.1 branched-chain amino acid ABC transporter permease [Halobacterium noricense]